LLLEKCRVPLLAEEIGYYSLRNSFGRSKNFRKQRIKLMTRRAQSLLGVFMVAGVMASPLTAQVKTKAVTHDLENKANCLMCHAPGVMAPVPDTPKTHEGRTVETCLWCHGAESAMVKVGAKQFTHDPAGKENCLMCHAPGVMPPVTDAPESHEGRAVETCTWCHTKVVGG
jgi:hypothetical protein